MYGSHRFKGIVPDHGSTALAVTYIGYQIKIPTNLGLSTGSHLRLSTWPRGCWYDNILVVRVVRVVKVTIIAYWFLTTSKLSWLSPGQILTMLCCQNCHTDHFDNLLGFKIVTMTTPTTEEQTTGYQIWVVTLTPLLLSLVTTLTTFQVTTVKSSI